MILTIAVNFEHVQWFITGVVFTCLLLGVLFLLEGLRQEEEDYFPPDSWLSAFIASAAAVLLWPYFVRLILRGEI